MVAYAELAVTTNFSFLRGASHPQEMVLAADALELSAIGIADRNNFAGVVRAYDQWRKIRNEKQLGEKIVKLLVGTRLVTIDGFEVLTYPKDRVAYGELCKLITKGNRLLDGKKAECHINFEDVLSVGGGQIFIVIPPEDLSSAFTDRLEMLARTASGRTYLAGMHRYHGNDIRRLGLLNELGQRTGAPLVAVNDVHYHGPERRALADVVTCIREKCTIHEAGFRLEANAERHLKSPHEMARLFRNHPDAIERTIDIANACQFTLEDLKNEYPDEPVPPGKTPQQHLEDLTWAGAQRRYPDGTPTDVVKRLKEELAIIATLKYAKYFLTVHDVVAWARNEKNILCQGRGSAANSAVCYCLGITEINPDQSGLLFARFISENRGEPPDIDVDFEHDRREEVMQYVYRRYGRHRAAICATVIHYRSRRAIREVGKALGLTPDITAALSKTVWGSHADGLPDKHIRQAGLDPSNRALMQAVMLARELIGFPRHLSQHVGGFILTRGRLDETVPIGNAAMEERTFIEWDKDDIDTLGLMKVDVLALGMLSCLRRGLDLMKEHYGKDYTLATLPKDGDVTSKPVYEMLSRADSVGVFQVESRAQMSMLPRLKPKEFYDLVIEVAIVRPGPIQGDMVHPYLRRRDGIEPEYYPSPCPKYGPANELEEVLKRTKGVPLFQEQAMQIAITAAEFTPDEADGLRRAMATFRHNGNVHLFRDKFIKRMTERGYDRTFVENCFGQIEGFGEYGFPESHAASFALLVYASAWIKCHYPEVFCAAILNSQPMGFYQPAQLVRDAREHGVEVKPVDVNYSDWDCTLEPASDGGERLAVRLGFRQIQGLNEDELKKLVKERGNGFASVERLAAVAGVSRFTIERLAAADAFRSVGLDRRAALWAARRLDTIGIRKPMVHKTRRKDTTSPLPLLAPHMSEELFPEPQIALPLMQLSEQVAEDYVATGLSLKAHPIRFFRERLRRIGAITTAEHRSDNLPQNQRITVAGLVLIRQMPGTAKGVVFLTIEDETGIANIIVWRKVFEKHRRLVMNSKFLAVRGRLQRAGLVIHVVAESFRDLSDHLRDLRDGELPFIGESAADTPPPDLSLLKSRDFH
ncbi:error-prone DNA polymerase [Pseudorhodoplanes sinuspersici]|uniref:Error-prone DNA polymerase n=1 Tax=Pseudorhodoplanes sinuspersici TaxID=1235591 RepID=A0A1W6ZUL6_9HYPH|nr:error-prone DNA polymerase [Pseudorhodoplanes sinuspersici]ARQ00986.1 error-prone DNA polymerase [Pseudorhodoplanes sinuspersici]RKE72623.1 DnaE-like error-prone DNA polymerase [Pseudorhodoplanes sinuspersici]